MALSKDISTQYGVNASYWRVIDVRLNVANKFAEVLVGGYLSAEARADNKLPLQTLVFSVSPDGYDASFATNENAIRQSYQHLKTLEQFQGATDV